MADNTIADFRAIAVQGSKAADGQSDKVSDKVEELARLQENSTRRTDYTRFSLAVIIMIAYVLAIGATLYWFSARIPLRSATSPAMTTLDPYSAAILDILKVIILPVVTFMLGFYFGTGSTARTQSK